MDIVRLADITIMVLAPGFGDDIQAMKAGLLEVADFLIVNKSDLGGADVLVMDMKQIFTAKEEESGIARVLQSIASEDKGIKDILAAVQHFSKYLIANNIKAKRRNKAMRSETLDWIFEMLRPTLTEKLNTQTEQGQKDPRVRAKEMIQQLLSIN
jgi:LAO/AO transport system kinase